MLHKGKITARVEQDFEYDTETLAEARELAMDIGPQHIVELLDIEITFEDEEL